MDCIQLKRGSHITLNWLLRGCSILVELEFRVLVLVEGGKPDNPEKNPRSKARTNDELSPYMTPGRNRTRAIVMGSEPSHHCATSASQTMYYVKK